MTEKQQPPALYQQPVPGLSPIFGNVIAGVYTDPDTHDVFSVAEAKTRTEGPMVTHGRRTTGGTSVATYETLSTIRASVGYRFTRIAVNRRDVSTNTKQASIFYQGYTGDVYEVQLGKTGNIEFGPGRISTIPSTESYPAITTNSPRFGTSFASAVVGENRDRGYLFYQAQDNRIYFISQEKSRTAWTEPSLVVADPTFGPTTLCACTWVDGNVDGITLIFNQQFNQYKIVELRLPRSENGTVTPFFEVAALFDAPRTRGPFSALRVRKGKCCLRDTDVHYIIYAQSENDPAVISELDIIVHEGSSFQKKGRDIVSQTTGFNAPIRGASIAAVAFSDPNNAECVSSVAVAWTTKEGRVLGKVLE